MPFQNIQGDPDICNNCFRRTHDRYERNYRVETFRDGGERRIWLAQVDGYDDAVYRRPRSTVRIPMNGGYRGMVTVCRCGFVYVPDEKLGDGEDWKNRPLRKETFFEYAANLTERLEENGVDFCESTFYETLERLKSEPQNQFRDDTLYKKACKRASEIATVRQDTRRVDSEYDGLSARGSNT